MNTPVDFGYWVVPTGQRQLLTWHPTSGILTLGAKPVAHISDETEIRARLAGWADHCQTKDGLSWLAQRLQGNR